ncbi:pyridoxal-phosphate dependent enzyme [Aestuariirhabdus sp. Z084]|uniref:pyridoxal-phosphate dependent enzyme n=1 Tax=Aestuariirhabdus haliotis TaxID=2918751 RepID=UPI00201B3D3A|nr:pyridoxal-phosphate dependent enzyme [Aestuariirhabdus haliotis]MCL6416788.1 pyridoxal-phosphate dependent enzyme [Aestuariirhabdus haliotis]MCL6420788.1 pyridoxal-phosphate dependent enzyme [Aestuariirhabdus haliotis]
MSHLHIRTPLLESIPLSQKTGTRVWLKMEALQPSGSFKCRGVSLACQHYVAQGATSLVASSGGNAGLAVAYAGRKIGVPVTVVVPETTSARAIELIRLQGAEVRVEGKRWNQSHEVALQLAEQGGAYIHPFDDPWLWQGHASMIDEVVEQGVRPGLVVLSVGGGGLLCGVIEGLRRNTAEQTPVWAVETEGAASFHHALSQGRLEGIDEIKSIATSLGALCVSERAFELSRQHPVQSRLVSDQQSIEACMRLLDEQRVLVEPACGASLAALYEHTGPLGIDGDVVVIVCGGVGTGRQQLMEWWQN